MKEGHTKHTKQNATCTLSKMEKEMEERSKQSHTNVMLYSRCLVVLLHFGIVCVVVFLHPLLNDRVAFPR